MEEKTGNRLFSWVVGVLVLIAILAFPTLWTVKGMKCASHMKENGMAIDVPPKLDGFGFSLKASQEAMDNKVPMNRELFETISRDHGLYIRNQYKVDEGISGFFFGIGVRLGR